VIGHMRPHRFRQRRSSVVIFQCTLAGCLLALFVQTLAAPALGDAIDGAAIEQHSLTPQSREHLQTTIKEDKEWYERGLWPLTGAVAALILTNAVAVGIVYLQSSKAFNAILRQRKIESLSTALNEFYNPLLALIDINKEIFSKTGPPSFPEEEISRNAGALVWKETKQKILINNQIIEDILKTKTHLLHATDSFEEYHDLMIHVAMYETFQKIETDLYRQFSFPIYIRKHVAERRAAVIAAFNELSGERI
jgi:hypothetical protein